DREIGSCAGEPGLADRRHDFLALGELLLDTAIQPLVLEVEDRVVVADRRLDETLRVAGRRGGDDLQAGGVEERSLGGLRVEQPAAYRAAVVAPHDDGGGAAGARTCRR